MESHLSCISYYFFFPPFLFPIPLIVQGHQASSKLLVLGRFGADLNVASRCKETLDLLEFAFQRRTCNLLNEPGV